MASELHCIIDGYNGAVVDLRLDCPAEELFDEALKVSLQAWKSENRRGVWLKIGVANCYCLAIADKHGFSIHHAQPGYVMMTKWLPEDEPNLLPGYASHYVGVAGLVINDQNELLVIKEKYAPPPRKALWKLPGGLMDPGENIGVAVAREVFEETGVRAEFVSIVSMRHTLHYQFKRGDFYTACHMRPKTFEICMCENEISDCRWMDMNAYLDLAKTGEIYELNEFIVRSFLQQQKNGIALVPTLISDKLVYTPQMTPTTSESEQALSDVVEFSDTGP